MYVRLSNIPCPPQQKDMQGAAVLLVTFLGGASALTGKCQDWYAHPPACHQPCGRNAVARTAAGLCSAYRLRSVSDAVALTLCPSPAYRNRTKR